MAERRMGQMSFADNLVADVVEATTTLDRIADLVDWREIADLLSGMRTGVMGAPSYPALILFKALLLQQWHGLSDPELEAALKDRLSFRRFLGVSLSERLPDHSSLWRFREQLAESGVAGQAFTIITAQIERAGFVLKRGTLIDATLIRSAVNPPPPPAEAPPDADGRPASKLVRHPADPEATWTRKQGRHFFGYKAHLAMDLGSRIIRRVTLTPANINDSVPADQLICADEATVWADKAYDSNARRALLRRIGVRAGIARRSNRWHEPSRWFLRRNAVISHYRAPIEPMFSLLKNVYGFARALSRRPAQCHSAPAGRDRNQPQTLGDHRIGRMMIPTPPPTERPRTVMSPTGNPVSNIILAPREFCKALAFADDDEHGGKASKLGWQKSRRREPTQPKRFYRVTFLSRSAEKYRNRDCRMHEVNTLSVSFPHVDEIRPRKCRVGVFEMKIKTILLSGVCVAAVAASVAASAADLSPRPIYKAPPMEPAPQFSWTGCYVGGNAGYGMASRKWNAVATTPTTAFVSQHTSGGGFVGGGQLGCDYQSGNWVVGIEGMVDGSTINYNTSIGNVLPGASLTDKVTSFETLTGRLGWAADRSLFYVKAGAAWDQTSGAINGPPGFSSESHSATNGGWVAGGGWEYAITPQWSGKIEYDYMGFGDRTINYPLTTAGTVNFTHQNLQTIMAGLNYRFYSGGQ